MPKQTIRYDSPLDALIDLAKRLQNYEAQNNMRSEDFFNTYSKGLLSDDIVYIEWSNDYRHYLALHDEIKQRLQYLSYASQPSTNKSIKNHYATIR